MIKKVHPLKKAAKNTLWETIGKILSAIIGFVSIPIILSFFPKNEYSLIVLVASLGSYLHIFLLEVPTGMVKYVASWLEKGDFNAIIKASRSNFTFHLAAGILNILILFIIALFAPQLFNLNNVQNSLFFSLILIEMIVILLSWPLSVINQILLAAEEIAFLRQVELFQKLVYFSSVIISVQLELNVIFFFSLISFSNLIGFPIKILRIRNYIPIKKILIPGIYWREFKEVLYFSFSLLILGIAKMSLISLRPTILAIKSNIDSITDYQVLFAITTFVLMTATLARSSLLPVVSKAYVRNDIKLLEMIAYKITKYYWVFFAPIIFGLSLCSKHLLNIWMGSDYVHLWPWLVIWLLSYFQSYLGTISTIFIGTGKIKGLVYFIPINTLVGLIIMWILAPNYGVGSIAIGMFIYSIMQTLGFHLYFLPKKLQIDSSLLFRKTFLPTLINCLIMILIGYNVAENIAPNDSYLWLLVAILSGAFVYILGTVLFIIKPQELKTLYYKLRFS
jgi:O-antigen/teichoic acid export membrane protein